MHLSSPTLSTTLRGGALCAVLAVGLSACGGGGGDSSSSSSAAAPGSTSAPAPATSATATGDAGASTAASAGAAQTLLLNVVETGGKLGFDKTTLTAKAGSITLHLKNGMKDHNPHAIAIRGNGAKSTGQVVQPGGDSELTAELKPGTYTYYCPVGEHEKAGMKGTLTVS